MKKNSQRPKVSPKVAGNTNRNLRASGQNNERRRAYCLTIWDQDKEEKELITTDAIDSNVAKTTCNEARIFDRITTILTSGIFDNSPIGHLCKCLTYVIKGREKCPTTQRIHYQTYFYFRNKIAFNAIKQVFRTAKIIPADGTALQNKIYCSKDGDEVFEWGVMPEQGKKKYSIEEIKNFTDEQIIANVPITHVKSYMSARDILNSTYHTSEMTKKVSVYFISGPSGIGKTTIHARKIIDDNGGYYNYINCKRDFYMGTGNCKVALYDDWRDSHMTASDFIHLIDYTIHDMNIKNGSRKNKYEVIIITTVQKLENIYKNCKDEPRAQWERRINYINLWPPEVEGLDEL